MWDPTAAQDWWQSRPRSLGCNYLPASAVNSTEMWQAATFDPATADRELAWAADFGLNTVRVFLQYHVHAADPAGHLDRLGRFIDLAAAHGIDVMPVLFDDCAFGNAAPTLGPQPDPVPGVHNSRWTPSPGPELALNPDRWEDLRRYVDAVVTTFAGDARILAWDVYNEPGNSMLGTRTLPLVDAAFGWVREAGADQPVTAGAWWAPSVFPLSDRGRAALAQVRAAVVARSDIVSFHSYEAVPVLAAQLAGLGDHGRPLLCTEWLARIPPVPDPPVDFAPSLVATHLPFFAAEGIGAIHWGLVKGRTQTHLPWVGADGRDPGGWFHDLLHPDGTPYDRAERELFRRHSPRPDITLP